jgi:hypothetical protein
MLKIEDNNMADRRLRPPATGNLPDKTNGLMFLGVYGLRSLLLGHIEDNAPLSESLKCCCRSCLMPRLNLR